jgi:hypothetical protein
MVALMQRIEFTSEYHDPSYEATCQSGYGAVCKCRLSRSNRLVDIAATRKEAGALGHNADQSVNVINHPKSRTVGA